MTQAEYRRGEDLGETLFGGINGVNDLGKESIVRYCEWCNYPLPNERYHLRICPSCRTESIAEFMRDTKNQNELPARKSFPFHPSEYIPKGK